VPVLSEEGQSWVRVGQSKKWTLVKPEDIKDIVGQLQDSGEKEGGWTGGFKAALALGIIVLLVLLVGCGWDATGTAGAMSK